MNAKIRLANNFDVTTFRELNFKHSPTESKKQSIVQFSNGYGASVVLGPYTYGGKDGLYELAVYDKDGQITYDTPITNDVLGYLSEEDVEKILTDIKNLE